MDVRRFQEDIEFGDEQWQPVLGRKRERFLSRLLPCLVASALYLLAIDLGFLLAPYLQGSPVVKIAGFIFGYIVSTIGIVIALCTAGLFGGNFAFVKSVLCLPEQADFRISIVFFVLSSFFARIVVGMVKKADLSYSKRLKLLYVTSATALIAVSLFFSFVNKADEPATYYFIYSLLGIVYLLFARTHVKEKQAESNFSRNRTIKQRENYSWDELKKIFKDLAN